MKTTMLHFLALSLVLAVTLVVNSVPPAAAQALPEPGRYEMEWSILKVGQPVDLTYGLRQVDVVKR